MICHFYLENFFTVSVDAFREHGPFHHCISYGTYLGIVYIIDFLMMFGIFFLHVYAFGPTVISLLSSPDYVYVTVPHNFNYQ